MNKIKGIWKTIDRRWRKLPRIIPTVVLVLSTFLAIHYSFIWFIVILGTAFASMLFIPENNVSFKAKEQNSKSEKNDVKK